MNDDSIQMEAMMAVRETEQHVPTDECRDVHCHWHHVDEPGAGYRLCGECFHLFRTGADLRWAQRRLLLADWRWSDSRPRLLPGGSLPSRPSALAWLRKFIKVQADQIYACPMCSHDF